MNIALIGYRGSGKSCVGRLVATHLGWPCIDVDAQLERQAGLTIREIFEREGEAGFRDRETRALRELVRRDQTVLALGGGVVLRPENRDLLRGCRVVWLRARPEVLFARMAADPTTGSRRPNLTARGGLDEVHRLLDQRRPFYRECAEFVIDTDDQTPEQIAADIVSLLEGVRAP